MAALVTVADGAQEAIAAALGSAADAVAVAGLDAAVAILETLQGEDAGSTSLVIAGARSWPPPRRSATAGSSFQPARSPRSTWCAARRN